MLQGGAKNVYKLGEMVIDPKQVFWKRQYIYACIPFVQLLKGHVILTPRRMVPNFKDLEPAEVFDLSLAIRFVAKCLESYFNCPASTIYTQNSATSGGIGQMIVHVFPRKSGDLKRNDDLYDMINSYPEDLTKYYNEKIASYGNAYVGKILEAINEERIKYEEFMNNAFKDEQSF